MAGKTALVSGATFGIGRETALGLLWLGARVVILGRDAARTQAAAQWLSERFAATAVVAEGGAAATAVASGAAACTSTDGTAREGAQNAQDAQDVRGSQGVQSAGARIETEIADLSSQREIRELAARLRGKYERLDVLVNNAGALYPNYRRSADGLELTWALNHLGYFLLTLELLPLLQAAPSARIVNVVSKLHKRAGGVFYDPQWDAAAAGVKSIQGAKKGSSKGYKGSTAYARSKLGNILFTYALARQLEGTGVAVNCVSPGIVGSGLNRNMPLPVRLLAPLFNRIALSPAQGAQTSVFVASAPELEGVSGRYFYKNALIESSPQSYDEELQQALWELSLRQCGRSR